MREKGRTGPTGVATVGTGESMVLPRRVGFWLAVLLAFLSPAHAQESRVTFYLVADKTPSFLGTKDEDRRRSIFQAVLKVRKALGLVGLSAEPVWQRGDSIVLVEMPGVRYKGRELATNFAPKFLGNYTYDGSRIARNDLGRAFQEGLIKLTSFDPDPVWEGAALSRLLRYLYRYHQGGCGVVVLLSDLEDQRGPSNPPLSWEEAQQMARRLMLLRLRGLEVAYATNPNILAWVGNNFLDTRERVLRLCSGVLAGR